MEGALAERAARAASEAPPKEAPAPPKTENRDTSKDHLAPCLEIEIRYGEKLGNLHQGVLILHNIGGGVLKGTLKALHPSVKVRPSVFRNNDEEITYTIDENDKPGSLKRMAISINHQGAKQEVAFEALMPAAKLKLLAGKVLDIVKNLRDKRKAKS